MPHSTLTAFSAANDAAAATTKKLEKQAILAAYLKPLDDDDLRLAVRYAAGRPFASTEERTLNVGSALVSEVVLSILDLEPAAYSVLVRKSGEIGEALSVVWKPLADSIDSRLTLQDLHRAFEDLALTGNRENKRETLHALFSRCATGREAAYVAKIISGDLRTGVQEGVLQAAVSTAFQQDAKVTQRCQLLVGDLGDVAVLAKHGACDTARFQLFHPIQFMLATPQETAQDAAETMDGRAFFAEDKLDGIRAQVHKSGDRIAIYTRTMDRTDASFPDVVDALRTLPGDFLLDGEIVPFANGQVQPFANIQKRLGRKVLTTKILRDHPAVFIAFDVLYRDGVLLIDLPLRERREVLDSIASQLAGRAAEIVDGHSTAPVSRPALLLTALREVSTAEEIDAAFCSARACRNEGLVLKDPSSPYSPGRRGQMWLKIKTHLPTLDCVVTAAEYGHGKRRSSLSDYTFAVWNRSPTEDGAELVNIGKAYSGVTDEEIKQLTELFQKITIEQLGRVHLVQPQVVFEIAFDQIQESARHASGYALRFPRIKRIRWDKTPADADQLAQVRAIFESVENTAFSIKPSPVAAEPTLFDHLS